MRRLILLRHAKSDRPPGTADEDRPLSERGAAAARLMGGYLARHDLIPELILCSPSRRTRDTLTEMVPQWSAGFAVDFDERLYLATARTLLGIVRAQPRKAAVVMVIGHNPGMHEAADQLIASGDVALRERLQEKFPTSALAVIDFAVADWSKLHDQSGRLDRFVTPRSIAAATS